MLYQLVETQQTIRLVLMKNHRFTQVEHALSYAFTYTKNGQVKRGRYENVNCSHQLISLFLSFSNFVNRLFDFFRQMTDLFFFGLQLF
jgi:hypothetical protein